jgi:hypothetical protein
MEHSSLEIKLKRLDKVYKPNEKVDGVVIVNANKGWSHNGLLMDVEGSVRLNHNSRGLGLAGEAPVKPIMIVKQELDLTPSGKFANGLTEIPFEFKLTPLQSQSLLESYHGIFIAIIYEIIVFCERRGIMKKALNKTIEFLVEIPSKIPTAMNSPPIVFEVTPESLTGISSNVLSTVPKFKISGKVHKSSCAINQPFTGEVIIELSEAPIRSLELQLVRVETVTADGKLTKEATEVENIQIGEGNICRNLIVPMYMVFPRLYSCPTSLANAQFKIEFEVNLIVVFGDGYMITENFPINLFREE